MRQAAVPKETGLLPCSQQGSSRAFSNVWWVYHKLFMGGHGSDKSVSSVGIRHGGQGAQAGRPGSCEVQERHHAADGLHRARLCRFLHQLCNWQLTCAGETLR